MIVELEVEEEADIHNGQKSHNHCYKSCTAEDFDRIAEDWDYVAVDHDCVEKDKSIAVVNQHYVETDSGWSTEDSDRTQQGGDYTLVC